MVGSSNATNNGASTSTGRFSENLGAYSFDGNDNINLGVWNKPDTGVHTITAWIYLTNVGNTYCGVYLSNNILSPYEGLAAYIQKANGAIGTYVNTSYRWSSILITKNQWTFVRWEFFKDASSGYVKVSKNNEALSTAYSGNTSSLVLNTSNPQYIGMWSGGNNYFGGSISDVRIYNRALSLDEITAIYNATRP